MSTYARATTDHTGKRSIGDSLETGELKVSNKYGGTYRGHIKKQEIPMTCCFIGDCFSTKGGAFDLLAHYILRTNPELTPESPCHRGSKGLIKAISVQGTEYRHMRGKIYKDKKRIQKVLK